jgi:hypothetical protein
MRLEDMTPAATTILDVFGWPIFVIVFGFVVLLALRAPRL